MQVFKYPFRFSGGKVVKIDVNSSEHDAQVISNILQTGKGELPLAAAYGTNSAEFSTLDSSGLMYSLASYYPDVSITKITEKVNPQTQKVEIRIEFSNATNPSN